MPLPREEGIGVRNVLESGKRHVVEAIEVDDDVELAAQRHEVVERHQLLRLLVAADGRLHEHELPAGEALASRSASSSVMP